MVLVPTPNTSNFTIRQLAAIGIDNNEWVIAVGSGADTTYTTVVDTVGNNPAGGYWQVPGTGRAYR